MQIHRALAVGAALCLAAAPADAGVHEDARLGFRFSPPRSYQAVALRSNEKATVARYQSTKKSTSSHHTYLYNTLRVAFYPASGVPAGQSREEFLEQLASRLEANHGFCDDVDERHMKIARLPAWERILDPTNGSTMQYQLFIDAEDGVFVFLAAAFRERFDKEVKTFRKAARSFRRIPKEEQPADEAEQLSDKERFLVSQVERLPPGWKSLERDRQLVLYNADRDFVDDVSKNLTAIRGVFEKVLSPGRALDYTQVVRVCDGRQTANNLSTRTERSGTQVGELVTYPQQPEERSHMLLRFNAYFQHVRFQHGELTTHPWYGRGHANYFAGADMTRRFKVKGFADQPPPWAMVPTLDEVLRLTRQGKGPHDGGLTPLRDFLAMSWQQYEPRRKVHEAQGWALIHMLREHRLPERGWRELLDTYLDNMKAARDEVAGETMRETVRRFEKRRKLQGQHADEDEEPPSQEPADYFGKLDDHEVQARAYQATFDHWTDEDWQRFQDFFITYAKRL